MTTRHLREINQRGVVFFRIPESWEVEFGEDMGGIFWDPQSIDGTLRLDILTFERSGPVDEHTAFEIARRSAAAADRVAKLSNGNALRQYDETVADNGDQLHMRYWELVHPVPPRHFCMAIFSYTLTAEQIAGPEALAVRSIIGGEIEAARFSPELASVLE